MEVVSVSTLSRTSAFCRPGNVFPGIITALGIFLKPEELYEMLLAAVLISAAWSGILMGIFKKKRNTEIPFVPFLLAGYAGGLFLWK